MSKFLIFLFCGCCGHLSATSISTKEELWANGLANVLWQYHRFVSPAPPEGWADLERANAGFIGTEGLTSSFSFIPTADRGRFPLGNLILVQSSAMPWPDAWKSSDPAKPNTYRSHESHKEIRYLIYESNGEYVADYWYETKFQVMLAETGMRVTPPADYASQLHRNTRLPAQSPPILIDTGGIVKEATKPAMPMEASTSTSDPSSNARGLRKSCWGIGFLMLGVSVVFIAKKRRFGRQKKGGDK